MTQDERTIAGLKLLVVDDTATNRHLLQIFLRKLGATVLLAEDGAKAVEAFEQHAPDLVLMDVMMPVMDGYEATRRIKALSRDRWTPVVFLSALDKDENLVAGLEAGGDDYLAKPVNFVVLNAKLRSLARTLELQRSLDDARRRTQAISDNISDCVITIDDQGRIGTANAAVRTVLGYEPDELIGQNVSVLIPEPQRSEHDAYLRAYVLGGPPHIIGLPARQVLAQHKQGPQVPVELTVAEMRYEGQRLFVGILRDVSERAEAERQRREHAQALQRYHDELEAEKALAAGIMNRLLLRQGLADPRVHHWLAPASDFSGDVVAAARGPDGRLYAMLADATGHGLAAAISVLPVLTTFYGLVERGIPLTDVAGEMNRRLLAFMPTGRFVAASLVCVDPQTRVAELWVGGMPDLLLVDADGTVHEHIVSSHLPLGIVEFDPETAAVQRVACAPGSQLVLYSDGLPEAADAEGNAFGADRLLRALARAEPEDRLAAVKAALGAHTGLRSAQDDVSMLLIDC